MSTALAPTPPASSLGVEATPNTTGAPSSTSRQMRLKVSYTFDEENKSNCLARWPHLVSTPVVQVDADLLVGAVELKTCILSIISASPELVATLQQDYSVYAYDFSESGFPLVGCGMLSWAMLNTQNSSTRIMVTGRVSCNTFGIFSDDGIKETLEVKFRLQKVETFTQEQFVKSVHTYTALARTLPGDFDASAWSNFVNNHPQILITHTAPRLPDPPRLTVDGLSQHPRPVPSMQWKDGTQSSTTDDIRQPPKKKQKTAARRPAKSTAGKKKTTTSPVGIPAAEPTSIPEDPLQSSFEASQTAVDETDSSVFGKPSDSRDSSTLAGVFAPQSEASPSAMASSPPGQSETGDILGPLSPVPTSPCLPLLPLSRPAESARSRTLETLFEEPEPPHSQDPKLDVWPTGGLVLPTTQPRIAGNPFSAVPDDSTVTAAPSPEPSQFVKVPKKVRRKPAKKDTATPSDAVAPSSDACYTLPAQASTGIRLVEKPKSAPRPRTAKHVKERIENQLLEAIKSGKMPNYCMNCGAIETAVWRRVRLSDSNTEDKERGAEAATPASIKSEEQDGVEGETAQTVMEKEQKEKEKEELEKEEREKEVLLCNACGLWFFSHKTMRPQHLWDEKKEPATKAVNAKKRKKSSNAATPPASTTLVQQQPSEADMEAPALPDEPTPKAAPPSITSKVEVTPSSKRSVSKEDHRIWAPSTMTGCGQSSPLITGTANSPIDIDAEIDGAGSPRRLLFPTSRKVSGSKRPVPAVRAPGKENKPPGEGDQVDGEPKCPKTPTRDRTTQLRTPLRSASRSLPVATIGLSPCRSAKRIASGAAPATPERRLLKSHQQRISLSPTAGLLEKLLADDAMMAEFANSDAKMAIMDNMAFNMDDDFLNTDMTMPSSPPGFGLFDEHEGAMSDGFYEGNGDWSDFLPSTPSGLGIGDIFDTQSTGKDSQNGLTVDLSAFIDEHSATVGTVHAEVKA